MPQLPDPTPPPGPPAKSTLRSRFAEFPLFGRVAIVLALTLAASVLVLGAVNGAFGSSKSDLPPATAREKARIIWDAEADDLNFCTLYWGLPYAQVYEEVFLVRASGVSNSEKVADEMLLIAAIECPEP